MQALHIHSRVVQPRRGPTGRHIENGIRDEFGVTPVDLVNAKARVRGKGPKVWSFVLGLPELCLRSPSVFRWKAIEDVGSVDSRSMQTAPTNDSDDQGREEAHDQIQRYYNSDFLLDQSKRRGSPGKHGSTGKKIRGGAS
jgi:hypothetical protein